MVSTVLCEYLGIKIERRFHVQEKVIKNFNFYINNNNVLNININIKYIARYT